MYLRITRRSLKLRPVPFFFVLPLIFFFLQGCASSSVSVKQDPPAFTISISPTAASVATTKTQPFTATVANATNTAVTWQVNGVTGGDSTHGTISASGLYTAPSAVPNPATVTVAGILQTDPTKSASATVTITASQNPVVISISPTVASVVTTKTQPFTATVTNTTNTAVTWQVNGVAGGDSTHGTISASGLYTAPSAVPNPATVTVSAISQADPTKSASATVAISAAPDTTAPTAPSGLTAAASSTTQIGLTWAASTDNVAVTSYRVERCTGASCTNFAQIGTTTTLTTFPDSGLTASTAYRYRVLAADAAGNLSTYSNIASATTLAASDTTAPTAPSSLAATASSSTQIGLVWIASTDNVGVTGYRVERCTGASCTNFAQIGTTTTLTTFPDSGLTASTAYRYRVLAADAAGNLSTYSNIASATTLAASDTTAPTAPSSLAATASSSTQIGLTWAASTDNVAVTGYRVERCTGASCTNFAQIGTTNGANATTFSDSGLVASTSYSYRVRATDAAGNLSNYSNTASATTSGSGGSSITVSVSPRRGGLVTSQTLPITATLANDTGNQGVNWSSNGGGSFSPGTSTSGNAVIFTAPASAGVVTITATSIADGTKAATATVGVTDLAGVTTYLNGNSRQGANLQEQALATSGATAVNTTNFGKLFSCAVDAPVYAQPLWAAKVSISGVAHNVVYVATQHNTMYAFDADSASCLNVWGGAKNLNPAGQTWVASTAMLCTDLQPDIGIVGTPVIDLSSKTIFVVTKSRTTSGTTTYHQQLHALDLATGSEKLSGPVEISATFPGTGGGSSGGILNFDAAIHNQRPALLLENGHVIITWASHCDNFQYHGWLISYNASTLARDGVLNLTPNGALGGIWMSGGGPAADSSGNIYLATGNGTFDANLGGSNYGDSIVKVGPPSGGTFPPVASFFAPSNQATLEMNDTDQGSGGVLLLPDVIVSSVTKSDLVQAGKDGNLYLADRSSLGGYDSASNNVVQEVSGQIGALLGTAVYWNGTVYTGSASGPVRAFSFNAGSSGLLSVSPTSTTSQQFGFPGPTPSVSSRGTTNGIIWALDNSQFKTSCPTGCQGLFAYDATNLGTLLYSSSDVGSAVKFTVPTIANGKVYIGGQNTLAVYGLLP
jgi:chitodextrinase